MFGCCNMNLYIEMCDYLNFRISFSNSKKFCFILSPNFYPYIILYTIKNRKKEKIQCNLSQKPYLMGNKLSNCLLKYLY